MKINVIGLGYIGLPTAVVFAKYGADVLGVDISANVVDIINKGNIHIEEPGLAELVREVVVNGNLRASVKPREADVHIIAVPTPNNEDELLSCDLTYVIEATKSISKYVKNGDIIIIESTIEPRTTDDFIVPIFEKLNFEIGKDIYIAHCPERVLPGQILKELVNNNRIVGGVTKNCSDKAAEVYELFVKGEIIKTEAKTAEMSKLMENTFRDVNIALANELTKICNKLHINVLDVIEMANKHPRVNIHTPGPGVGGHCIAVDPYFIYAKAPELAKIIKTARDVNNSMPNFVVDKVEKLLKYDKSKNIACLGVSYKPNVDDVRESPALKIIKILENKGYNLKIHDPYVKNNDYYEIEDAIKGVDLILILVGHDSIKSFDYNIEENKTLIFDVTGSIKFNENILSYGNNH